MTSVLAFSELKGILQEGISGYKSLEGSTIIFDQENHNIILRTQNISLNMIIYHDLFEELGFYMVYVKINPIGTLDMVLRFGGKI